MPQLVSREQALAAEGHKVEWRYDEPAHALSNDQAWQLAQRVRAEFMAVRSRAPSAEAARQQLVAAHADIARFADRRCFYQLFKLLCDDSTTERDVQLVGQLVRVRARVLVGELCDAQASEEVLHLVAAHRGR